MDFGEAIRGLKLGYHVARSGWNGKGMHIYLEQRTHLKFNAGCGRDTGREYDPVICMYTAQGTHQAGWLASQADMLAEDWQQV